MGDAGAGRPEHGEVEGLLLVDADRGTLLLDLAPDPLVFPRGEDSHETEEKIGGK